MTSNQERATILTDALHALVAGDQSTLARLLTDDVRVWTPEVSTSTRDEFLEVLDHRNHAFTDANLLVVAHDVGGDFACAEWTIEMRHTGPIELDDRPAIAASGELIELHGVTVGEFIDGQICSIRQYWNERSLLDQLSAP